jgi:hypothetical protein
VFNADEMEMGWSRVYIEDFVEN